MFAKLYDTVEHGQILVLLGACRETLFPQLRFIFQDESAGFKADFDFVQKDDSQESFDRAKKAFQDVDEKIAVDMVGIFKDGLIKPFSFER